MDSRLTLRCARYPSVAAALQAAKLTPQQHEAYRAALGSAYIYAGAFTPSTQNSYVSSSGERKSGAQFDSVELAQYADSVQSLLGVEPTSALAKNREFLSAHPDEFQALEATKMWATP